MGLFPDLRLLTVFIRICYCTKIENQFIKVHVQSENH